MYMPATVWKGHLSFGLVSIRVRLYRAARAQRVNLRQLYRPNQREERGAISDTTLAKAAYIPELGPMEERTREFPEEHEPGSNAEAHVAPVKRVYEPADGAEREQPLRDSDLVKGYEYTKGQYVVVDEETLRSITPKTSTEMQILEFVRFSEIDPVYLETSYYLAPDQTGEKAYALLFKGMVEAGYAAIGRVTMHRRDHIVIVRPGKTGLIAHTMFYTDEVRTVDEFRTDASLVSAKELDLAKTLIQALATSFEPDKFKNEFRERLHQLIDSRAAREQVVPAEPPSSSKVIDIMGALKRSLAEVKTAKQVSQPDAAKVQRKPASAVQSIKKSRTRRPQGKR
jgi:DNA end-binding protein Ku